MYGLVNQAVKDLVQSKFGDEAWSEICKTAKIQSNDFVAMQYYPDTLTYELVGAASKHLKLDPHVILTEFGKHWVLFTAKNGYGPLMDLFGNDYKTCLNNLNNLHARMGMSLPQLTPPRFVFTEVDSKTYQVEYQSKRAGLSPMVLGLLQGLAEKYGEKVTIEHIEGTSEPVSQTFIIRIVE